MVIVNTQWYLCTSDKYPRNWWLIKENSSGQGYVSLSNVFFPKGLIGKRVRFKVEILAGDE